MAKEREEAAAMVGPPNGPPRPRVSATRQGATGMKRSEVLGDAACQMTTGSPATVSVVDRALPALGATLKPTPALPSPAEVPVRVVQPAGLEAVQGQPQGAVNRIVPVPPSGGNVPGSELSVYVQGASACVIVTAIPATANVATWERPMFGDTARLTVAGPWPDVWALIHKGRPATPHQQPGPVCSERDTVPPAPGAERAVRSSRY